MATTLRAFRSINSLKTILGLLLVCGTPMMTFGQSQAAATTQLEAAGDHLRGGSDLVFRMKLNEALPEGARFDVRLSPVGVDQEIAVQSGEPANKERTEFILKTKLPERAVPGEWHIKVVWLFLPGASWTNNTLTTNADFRFLVEGPKFEVPTKATVTLVDDHR
ncbi:MAG: hypothetical protein WBY53_13530 [Acidobacteriaceae bacterium]